MVLQEIGVNPHFLWETIRFMRAEDFLPFDTDFVRTVNFQGIFEVSLKCLVIASPPSLPLHQRAKNKHLKPRRSNRFAKG